MQKRRWIYFIAIPVIICVFVFSYALKKRSNEIKNLVSAATKEEVSYMLGNLNDRFLFIVSDLMDAYGESSPSSQMEHLKRTNHLIQANPFILTINYIGQDRRISFVSPLETNKQVIGLKIEIPAPKEAMEKAAKFGRPYLSRSFAIVQDQVGYSLMIPFLKNDFFEIVFQAKSVFGEDSAFRNDKNITIQITDGVDTVFKSFDYDNELSKSDQFKFSGKGKILNRSIVLSALPRAPLFKNAPGLWRFMAISSFVVTFILLLTIIFMQALGIRERKLDEQKREKLINELQEALAKVKTLSGMLPICANCKMVRDDKGYWKQIESYIRDHSEAEFSHSICPACVRKLYPELNIHDD